jgi:hypothetical protein
LNVFTNSFDGSTNVLSDANDDTYQPRPTPTCTYYILATYLPRRKKEHQLSAYASWR